MARTKKSERSQSASGRKRRARGESGTGLRSLLAAKRAIERTLREHVALRHQHGPLLHKKYVDKELRNLVGIAIGQSHSRDGAVHAESAAPGEPVLLVMLEDPRRHSEVRTLLKRLIGVNAASITRLPFEVIVTGAVRAHGEAFRLRPAAPGTSISNCSAPSGTFGFLARGRTLPRANQRFVVSNFHVLVSEPGAPPANGVAQPGRTDGGSCPTEQIAVLEKFVPIQFGGPNKVDVAAALAPPAMVRPELVFIQNGNPVFVPLGKTPVAATAGLTVGKSGRSTGLTMGRVLSASSSVIVTYGTRSALFVDQILVTGLNGPFSDAGDSGSLVWTWDQQRNPVGMLFGGARGVSFVNHIEDVMDALDVEPV